MARHADKGKRALMWVTVAIIMLVLPATVSAEGQAEKNVKIVKQVYAYFAEGNIEGVLGLLTEDYEQTMPGDPNFVPWAGTFRGTDGFIKFGTILGENAEFLISEHREYIAQGDKVAVINYEQIRAKPTGRIMEFEAVAVWTLRGGKVARTDVYEDTAPIEKAFR